MPTDTTPPAASRGRPAVRPEGVRRRNIYLTDPEFALAQARAWLAGQSTEQWIRGLVVAAIAPEKPQNSKRK